MNTVRKVLLLQDGVKGMAKGAALLTEGNPQEDLDGKVSDCWYKNMEGGEA